MLLDVLLILNGVSFLFYGLLGLYVDSMKQEFERFGLTDDLRILLSMLHLLGGIGVLMGLVFPFIGVIAALGLFVLMLLGFRVRIQLKDDFRKLLPALSLFSLNIIVFVWLISIQGIL